LLVGNCLQACLFVTRAGGPFFARTVKKWHSSKAGLEEGGTGGCRERRRGGTKNCAQTRLHFRQTLCWVVGGVCWCAIFCQRLGAGDLHTFYLLTLLLRPVMALYYLEPFSVWRGDNRPNCRQLVEDMGLIEYEEGSLLPAGVIYRCVYMRHNSVPYNIWRACIMLWAMYCMRLIVSEER